MVEILLNNGSTLFLTKQYSNISITPQELNFNIFKNFSLQSDDINNGVCGQIDFSLISLNIIKVAAFKGYAKITTT